MKKINLFVLALLCVPVLLLSSCDRGDDINPENPILQPAFDVMKNHMMENELDLTNILKRTRRRS